MMCDHQVPEPDGQPVLFIHPDEPDIAAVKHAAALAGTNVIVSIAVPVGQRFIAPSGMPRFRGEF